MHDVLENAKVEQHNERAILTASASVDQLKALTTAHSPLAAETNPPATPAAPTASKH